MFKEEKKLLYKIVYNEILSSYYNSVTTLCGVCLYNIVQKQRFFVVLFFCFVMIDNVNIVNKVYYFPLRVTYILIISTIVVFFLTMDDDDDDDDDNTLN